MLEIEKHLKNYVVYDRELRVAREARSYENHNPKCVEMKEENFSLLSFPSDSYEKSSLQEKIPSSHTYEEYFYN